MKKIIMCKTAVKTHIANNYNKVTNVTQANSPL